ncbi:MAG: bifunctional glutamate N-acetyltransferase/amino-acid acetyltransferase ArgJ [Alphaproteobacteria bacterium]|nr:bifunctional glutamate N-acetyltransferase/amino-acid acetyltransferase ArgJ [Alphaproteobacteria bacterium]
MTKEAETSPDQAPDQIIADLQKKLSRLRRKLKSARAELADALGTPGAVSPLAPVGGFPDLPVIDGIMFSAAAAGVKYQDRTDVMLASIAPGASIAGVFTKSSTRSAPVLDCQQKLADLVGKPPKDGFAILVNSGNANAFTGALGVRAVETTTGAVADTLDIPESHVFTASTGVIGEPLPADRIIDVLAGLKNNLSTDGAEAAANAIMTTDTFAKGASATVDIDGKTVRIVGFAKGSGMIAPDMATMLVFIFTDAKISQAALQRLVSRLNRSTFNAITVDSDTSTSDTLLVTATGRSGVEIGGPTSKSGKAFGAALGGLMRDLSHQVVRDGEGASKFLEVEVLGASSTPAAKKVALAIANSPLVKTAVAGEDPNWGRVVMAAGKSGAKADRDRISIWFGDILVAENGWVCPDYTEDEGATYMKRQNLKITVDLGIGKGRSAVWTCDFTKQYITINADYRS